MTERITDETQAGVARNEWQNSVGFVPQRFLRVNSNRYEESAYVRVSNDQGGRELLLDAKDFEQGLYEVDPSRHPHNAAIRIAREMGHENIHLTGIFDRGTNDAAGTRRSSGLYEGLRDAASRGADLISAAQTIDLERTVAQFAVWDNGAHRPIDEQIDMADFMLNHVGLGRPDAPEAKLLNDSFSVYLLARKAIFYGGSLVMAQRGQKTTITSFPDHTINRRDEALATPIEGVTTLLEVPYYFDVRTDPVGYALFHARNVGLSSLIKMRKFDEASGEYRDATAHESVVRYMPSNAKPVVATVEKDAESIPQ